MTVTVTVTMTVTVTVTVTLMLSQYTMISSSVHVTSHKFRGMLMLSQPNLVTVYFFICSPNRGGLSRGSATVARPRNKPIIKFKTY